MSAANHNEQSAETRLLRLPAELRIRVYYFALPEKLDLYCHGDHGDHYSRSTVNGIVKFIPFNQPPLLQVCQQIRNETIKIHYEKHAYNFNKQGTIDNAVENAHELRAFFSRFWPLIGRYVNEMTVIALLPVPLKDVPSPREPGEMTRRMAALLKGKVLVKMQLKDGKFTVGMSRIRDERDWHDESDLVLPAAYEVCC